jgi:hypothetical protein
MAEPQEFDDLWENAYYSFIESLRSLASTPEEICEQFGDFNVAFELYRDVGRGSYLKNSSSHRLSVDHIRLIDELNSVLNDLPPEAIASTSVAGESIGRLRHAAWVRPRELAAALLIELSNLTASNASYIYSDKAV